MNKLVKVEKVDLLRDSLDDAIIGADDELSKKVENGILPR
jgi:hypothetical protein